MSNVNNIRFPFNQIKDGRIELNSCQSYKNVLELKFECAHAYNRNLAEGKEGRKAIHGLGIGIAAEHWNCITTSL